MNTNAPSLSLYHKDYCPYCKTTRKVIEALSLDIELRDVQFNKTNLQALLSGGGKQQVPCLRIESADGDVEWLYESQDIIQYLRNSVSA